MSNLKNKGNSVSDNRKKTLKN